MKRQSLHIANDIALAKYTILGAEKQVLNTVFITVLSEATDSPAARSLCLPQRIYY